MLLSWKFRLIMLLALFSSASNTADFSQITHYRLQIPLSPSGTKFMRINEFFRPYNSLETWGEIFARWARNPHKQHAIYMMEKDNTHYFCIESLINPIEKKEWLATFIIIMNDETPKIIQSYWNACYFGDEISLPALKEEYHPSFNEKDTRQAAEKAIRDAEKAIREAEKATEEAGACREKVREKLSKYFEITEKARQAAALEAEEVRQAEEAAAAAEEEVRQAKEAAAAAEEEVRQAEEAAAAAKEKALKAKEENIQDIIAKKFPINANDAFPPSEKIFDFMHKYFSKKIKQKHLRDKDRKKIENYLEIISKFLPQAVKSSPTLPYSDSPATSPVIELQRKSVRKA